MGDHTSGHHTRSLKLEPPCSAPVKKHFSFKLPNLTEFHPRTQKPSSIFLELKLDAIFFQSVKRASESKSEMETLKQKQGEESLKLEKRKKAIEIELSEIEPLVQEAKDAVGDIKPESLSEIRSLRMPPDVIRDILEAVQRLMGIFDTSWVSMKR